MFDSSESHRDQLEQIATEDPRFQVRFGNRILCPACVQFLPESSKSSSDQLVDHLLEGCPKYNRSQDDFYEPKVLRERKELFAISQFLQQHKAWNCFDADNQWICPFCVTETDLQKDQSKDLSTWKQAVLKHLRDCMQYNKNPEEHEPLEKVQHRIEEEQQEEELTKKIYKKIHEGDERFRTSDKNNHWVCPYCVAPISRIAIPSKFALEENAPQKIARHLVEDCQPYNNDEPLHSVEELNENLSSRSDISTELPEGIELDSPDQFDDDDPGEDLQLHDAEPVEETEPSSPPSQSEAPPIETEDPSEEAAPETEEASSVDPETYEQLSQELEELRSTVKEQQSSQVQDDLQKAQRVQANLLPDQKPYLERYELGVLYRSCDFVGGDFYDFIQEWDHTTGLVLGDVSGHGLEAALIMSQVQKALQIRSQQSQDLLKILQDVNKDLISDIAREKFVSCFLGLFTPEENTLEFASAGHTPPLLMRSENARPTELSAQGPALGLFPSDKFNDELDKHTLQIEAGNVLFLFTDGIVEGANEEDEEFGLQRLKSTIFNNRHKPLDNWLESIWKTCEAFTESRDLQDDVTLLALKRIT